MWEIITGIGSAIGDFASGIFGPVLNWLGVQDTNDANAQNTFATNQANIQIANQTNALNEKLQREQWQRDDTAYQRQVADMSAAGLNPLSSFNSPTSGSLSTQMQAPTMNSFTAVAPQLQMANGLFNNLVDTVLKQEMINQKNKEINLHSILNGVDPNELDKVSSDSDTLQLFKDLFDARRDDARKNADSPYVRGEGLVSRTAKDIDTALKFVGGTVNNYVKKNSGNDLRDVPKAIQNVKIQDYKDTPEFRKDVQTYYMDKAFKRNSNDNVIRRLRRYLNARSASK